MNDYYRMNHRELFLVENCFHCFRSDLIRSIRQIEGRLKIYNRRERRGQEIYDFSFFPFIILVHRCLFLFFFFLSLLYMKFAKDQKRVKRRKEGKKTTVASSGSIAKKETPFELPLWFVISRVNEARNIGSMAKFVGQVVHPGLVSRRIILFPAHVPILLMPLRTYRVIETISNVVRRSSVNLIVNLGWIVPLARNKLLLPLRRIPRRVIDHVSHGQALPPSQASRVFKTPLSGRAVY